MIFVAVQQFGVVGTEKGFGFNTDFGKIIDDNQEEQRA